MSAAQAFEAVRSRLLETRDYLRAHPFIAGLSAGVLSVVILWSFKWR